MLLATVALVTGGSTYEEIHPQGLGSSSSGTFVVNGEAWKPVDNGTWAVNGNTLVLSWYLPYHGDVVLTMSKGL